MLPNAVLPQSNAHIIAQRGNANMVGARCDKCNGAKTGMAGAHWAGQAFAQATIKASHCSPVQGSAQGEGSAACDARGPHAFPGRTLSLLRHFL